ncbi:MAG: hypothetical protein ACYSSI_08060 [Planctomycetota bacterium]
MNRSHPKTWFVTSLSEKFVDKAGDAKGSEACFLHVENLFRRQRSPRTLQPSAVKGGLGMASNCPADNFSG